jgi:hypothetical protein
MPVPAHPDADGLRAGRRRLDGHRATGRRKLAAHAIGDLGDLIAIAVAGDENEGDGGPGEEVTGRMKQAAAVRSG